MTDQVIHDHLSGKHTIGVYLLFLDDTSLFLAVDFDEADWREDAKAFTQSCEELAIAAALEFPRSGNGRGIAPRRLAAGLRSARPVAMAYMKTWPALVSARCAFSRCPRASMRRNAESNSGADISPTGRAPIHENKSRRNRPEMLFR